MDVDGAHRASPQREGELLGDAATRRRSRRAGRDRAGLVAARARAPRRRHPPLGRDDRPRSAHRALRHDAARGRRRAGPTTRTSSTGSATGTPRSCRRCATPIPDLECWHFFDAPTPIAFWARRQAHETAIHRADVQSCTGAVTPYPTRRSRPTGSTRSSSGSRPRRRRCPTDAAAAACWRRPDVDREWPLQLGPERVDVASMPTAAGTRSPTAPSRAPASDLYLLLWNRDPARPARRDRATRSPRRSGATRCACAGASERATRRRRR